MTFGRTSFLKFRNELKSFAEPKIEINSMTRLIHWETTVTEKFGRLKQKKNLEENETIRWRCHTIYIYYYGRQSIEISRGNRPGIYKCEGNTTGSLRNWQMTGAGREVNPCACVGISVMYKNLSVGKWLIDTKYNWPSGWIPYILKRHWEL